MRLFIWLRLFPDKLPSSKAPEPSKEERPERDLPESSDNALPLYKFVHEGCQDSARACEKMFVAKQTLAEAGSSLTTNNEST
jgi:hypothetical protein